MTTESLYTIHDVIFVIRSCLSKPLRHFSPCKAINVCCSTVIIYFVQLCSSPLRQECLCKVSLYIPMFYHLCRYFSSIPVPSGGPIGGLGGLVPPNPKSRQKLSQKKNCIKSVGYTFRLKTYVKILPPPHCLLIFQSWRSQCRYLLRCSIAYFLSYSKAEGDRFVRVSRFQISKVTFTIFFQTSFASGRI